MALGFLGEDVGGLPGQSEEGNQSRTEWEGQTGASDRARERGGGREGGREEKEAQGEEPPAHSSTTVSSLNSATPRTTRVPLLFGHSGQSASVSSSCLSLGTPRATG